MVTVSAPGGPQSDVSSLALVSGTGLDGDYHAERHAPALLAQGTWTVELLLVDGAGNEVHRTSAELGADGSVRPDRRRRHAQPDADRLHPHPGARSTRSTPTGRST